MFKILTTKRFKKKLIKIIKNNSEFKLKLEKILTILVDSPFENNIGSHKLTWKLSGYDSCACGYDCRIIYQIVKEDNFIVVSDIGTHNDVYYV